MDVHEYLSKQTKRISDSTRWVKDYRVFEFSYVPDEPLMRTECQVLIDAMLRFNVTGIPTHLAIIGSRGSGKTLTLRFLQQLLPQQTDLTINYVNCRTHNTSFKILAHLLDVPARGTSLTELYERFCALHHRRTVIVLDEADLMSPKDHRREILYLLSRSEQRYMVILLSNNPHVLKELDAATCSSLQPQVVHFRNYDADQIRQILLHRARQGLQRWDDGDLAKIAALTTRHTNADARVAIKTLYYTVTEQQPGVDACFEQARQDIVVEMLSHLSDANLMMLWAAFRARADLARDVYRLYAQNCQKRHEKPFSYVHFNSHLAYLQSIGLITLVSTKVARTYANRILLNFDPETLESICHLRFEL